jgi:hypothetical protein
MTGRWGCIVGLVATCVALAAAAPAVEPVRIWGTCSGAVSQSPRYQNLWEYSLDIGWDATGWEPERLEQVALFLDLGACPCIDEPGYFTFPYTNGIGSGRDGSTIHYYYSGYSLVEGSPRFAAPGPAIVFEYMDVSSILNVQGTARFVFLSTARPSELSSRPGAIAIGVGPYEARGEITGIFPSCDCETSPVEPNATWGTIKSMFR